MKTFTIALLAGALLAAPAFAQGRGEGMAMLMRADANGDGAITQAEAQTARAQMFTQMDTNGDGFLSEADRTGQGAGQGDGRMLRRADANSDGRITREEYMAQPYRAFDHFDANSNHVLDASEIAQMRQMAGSRRSAR